MPINCKYYLTWNAESQLMQMLPHQVVFENDSKENLN